MLASINPLGERARGNRWAWTVAAYTGAAVAAAATVGAVLGLVAIGAGLVDLVVPGRLLTSRRQVDEDWMVRYRGWVYGAGFGAQLGAGVVTVITSATVYAWLAAALLSRSALAGAVVGAAFGVARSAPFAAVAGVRLPVELRDRLRRLSASARPSRFVAAGATIVAGATCLVTRPG